MKSNLHRWDLSPDEAIRVQNALREHLILQWDQGPVRIIGGVDISIKPEGARAAMVLVRFPELAPIEAVTADVPLVFPYIPGLLSFREGPAVLAAWERLRTKPDLLMFDGQGIAHPRGLGIAAQMGLWLELSTIGVATLAPHASADESRLFGRHAEVGPQRGDRADCSMGMEM